MMQIRTFTLGYFGVNNYVVYSTNSKKAVLIDTSEDTAPILQFLQEQNLQLVYLINTHGHADHIAGNRAILEATGAKLLVHPHEVDYLLNPEKNLSALFGIPIQSPQPDGLLNEGDVVNLEDIQFQVLHTPGHTPGHITLVADRHAFVGDVIFRDSIGRTDFPGSSHSQLLESIRTKILTLPDETTLYPGHGPETTVGYEKKFNPFLRE